MILKYRIKNVIKYEIINDINIKEMNKTVKKIEYDLQLCAVCNELAQFVCSVCEEIYYCRVEHQKADWINHKVKCKTKQQKITEFFEYKRLRKNSLVNELAKPDIEKAKSIIEIMIKAQTQFKNKHPDVMHEIEYGSTMCLYIRLWQLSPNGMNTAQELLQEYLRESTSFLSDLRNVFSLPFHDNAELRIRQHKMSLGKLRLLSTLATLLHENIRNSLEIYELLLTHIEKVYGVESLETANAYFYTGSYLMYLSQPNQQHLNKALGCFLKAGKMRGKHGGTACYNAAVILQKQGSNRWALVYFQKALELIEVQNSNHSLLPKIYEGLAIISLDMNAIRLTLEYFQKALYFYDKNNEEEPIRKIENVLLALKKATAENNEQNKQTELPKEKKEKKKQFTINDNNFHKFKYAKENPFLKAQTEQEWAESFKGVSWTLMKGDGNKIPKQFEQTMGNKTKKQQMDSLPKFMMSDSRVLAEGVNLDISYMRTLTANEVELLHEVNRLLSQCVERAAIYDILENSNFYQLIQHQRPKLHHFYRLNPQLVRPSDIKKFQAVHPFSTVQLHSQKMPKSINLQEQKEPETKVIKTPRLDLSKLKDFKAVQKN